MKQRTLKKYSSKTRCNLHCIKEDSISAPAAFAILCIPTIRAEHRPDSILFSAPHERRPCTRQTHLRFRPVFTEAPVPPGRNELNILLRHLGTPATDRDCVPEGARARGASAHLRWTSPCDVQRLGRQWLSDARACAMASGAPMWMGIMRWHLGQTRWYLCVAACAGGLSGGRESNSGAVALSRSTRRPAGSGAASSFDA